MTFYFSCIELLGGFLDSGQIIKQLVWCNVYLMGGLRKRLPPNSLIRPCFYEQSV